MAAGMSAPAVRAVLRHAITEAAHQARNETEFFAHLRSAVVEVQLRFSDITPDQVTGYAVTCPATRATTSSRCGTAVGFQTS